MKTIVNGKFLLPAFVLSLAASATASEFIYKPASPTVHPEYVPIMLPIRQSSNFLL